MAAGSGTAPENDHAPGGPEGWGPPRGGLVSPDPFHPLFPTERIDRVNAPRIRARIEANPSVLAAIDGLIALHGGIPIGIVHASDPETEDGQAALAWAVGIVNASGALFQAVGPIPGVLAADFVRYTLERAIARVGDIGAATRTAGLVGRPEPISLVANVGQETRSVLLRPGEIAMKFTSASQEDRVTYNALIERAQEFFGHPTSKGGRPSRDSGTDPGLTERTRLAAKLADWGGYTDEMIAEFFGWLPLGEGTGAAAHQAQVSKASEYVRDGRTLLDRELGVGWQANCPPQLGARAVLLTKDRPPQGRRRRVRKGFGSDSGEAAGRRRAVSEDFGGNSAEEDR